MEPVFFGVQVALVISRPYDVRVFPIHPPAHSFAIHRHDLFRVVGGQEAPLGTPHPDSASQHARGSHSLLCNESVSLTAVLVPRVF